MTLRDELTKIKKYKNASQLSSFVDIETLSNKQIIKIFNQLLPNQVIQIGSFHIYYLLRDVDQGLWKGMIEYVELFYAHTCRGEISTGYKKKFEEANLLVLCVSHDEEIYEEHGIDVMNGFFLAKYNTPKKEANVILICFQSLYTEDKSLKLGGGIFLHCLGLNILKQLNIENVYLEASVKELIPYYYQLGYRLGRENCDQEDKITSLHEKYNLDKVIERLPKNYANEDYDFAYRMKWCKFTEKDICWKAFEMFRDSIRKISTSMLKPKSNLKKEVFLGKYKIIKELSKIPIKYLAMDERQNIVQIQALKTNYPKTKERLDCVQKVKKFCEQLSCFVEVFYNDRDMFIVTEWKDDFVSLREYLVNHLEVRRIDGEKITKNIYEGLKKLYTEGSISSVSEDTILIHPKTLDIYISYINCEGDETKNENFVEELYDLILHGNERLVKMNKQIVKKKDELIKILKIKYIDKLDERVQRFGEYLNKVNFDVNNLNPDLYFASKILNDKLRLVENVENITKIILEMEPDLKKKWLIILNQFIIEEGNVKKYK